MRNGGGATKGAADAVVVGEQEEEVGEADGAISSGDLGVDVLMFLWWQGRLGRVAH